MEYHRPMISSPFQKAIPQLQGKTLHLQSTGQCGLGAGGAGSFFMTFTPQKWMVSWQEIGVQDVNQTQMVKLIVVSIYRGGDLARTRCVQDVRQVTVFFFSSAA